MWQYVVKRILIFIPVLVIVSMLTFWLSDQAPGDRVEDRCGEGLSALEYDRCARLFKITDPAFYFSIRPKAYPDSLYRFARPYQLEVVKRLSEQTGSWPPVGEYTQVLWNLDKKLDELPDTLDRQWKIDVKSIINKLAVSYDLPRIDQEIGKLNSLMSNLDSDVALRKQVDQLTLAYQGMIATNEKLGMYIPHFVWHGFKNRYHDWFSRFLKFDFGVSYFDSQPVSRKMSMALFWTLLLNIISFLLAYLIAIPIGVRAALGENQRFDRISSTVLFMLYSLPRFWIATIFIVFFTTNQYGNWMDIFPTIGLGDLPSTASFWERFRVRGSHLILPVICQTYGILAFISRQMRGGMLETIRQDYIRTARAKGLSENKVVWRHAFRNALFPMITILGAIIPASIAGSVIIEVIFAIPGMGRLMFNAIFTSDWPVLFTGLMMGAFLTLLGVLIADLLYAAADPRVRLSGNSKSISHD